MADQTLYQRLATSFDKTYSKQGKAYITGAQCVGRLNEVLGVDGWDFEILSREQNQDTDEIVIYARLKAYVGERVVVREQYGGQKINRTRSGDVIELANDIKGATTDALKKCASLLGVGLYLYPGDDSEPPSRVMHVQPTPAEQQRAEAAVNGHGAEPIDREAFLESWKYLVQEAERLTVDGWEDAKGRDASKWKDGTLTSSVGKLKGLVDAAKASEKPAS